MRVRADDSKAFLAKYGPWALVTGAAQGLGAAFARECALRGLDVVLVDRLAPEVLEQARRLARVHEVEARAVVLDLAAGDPWAALAEQLAAMGIATADIGLLVNNAGLGPVGPFFDQPLSRHQEVLAVNCGAPLSLTHHLGTSLRERGRGGVVFVSSLSGMSGTALVAHYAATKAWNLVLGESLWAELRGSGVEVLTAAVGATRTPAWIASQPEGRSLAARTALPPAKVAAEAMAALGRRHLVIPGLSNRLAAAIAGRLLPRRRAVELLARSMARLYPER